MNKFKPQPFYHRKPPPPPTSPSQPFTAPTSSTKSHNSKINHFSSQGAHHNVLLLYSTMLKTSIPPDPYTFPSLVKACTSLDLFSLGVSVHQHIIVNGYSNDEYIASSLISFYAKFGYTHVARRVFDVMPNRNVVPWTAIIGCYSRLGCVETAFCMYRKMQFDRIKPSSVTMLAVLSGVFEVTQVQSLHACIVQYGFECDIVLANCMLNLYGKCERIEDARNLFELMCIRDIVSWNSLVSGYALAGSVGEILQLLNQMRVEGMEPDQQTVGALLSATARRGNLKIGKLVHGQILTTGLELDAQVGTLLLHMYMKCGNVDDAFWLFKQISNKDTILWTSMISGLVQNECSYKALTLFRMMLHSRVRPSTATIASVLAACAHQGSLNLGSSVHGYMLRQSMAEDIPSQNSLVTMYAKCGHLEQSFTVFDMMGDRDVISWNAVVAGHAQNGHLCKALHLFNEMREGLEKPDCITVVSLLQACASVGAYYQGKWIHNFIIRSCLLPSLMIETALVDMYSKCGNLDSARKCFDRMSHHDVVSWSTMIAGYGSHGKGKIALEMYSEFLQTGLQPNHVTFLSILYTCSHNGLIDQGLSMFDTMTKDFKIEPKLEHCACIVDLLCRAGRVEHAYDFYKRMFTEPIVDVLGILLDACRTKGYKELGDIVANDIFMLKPADAGNYVQLVNNYASTARWDDVGEAWIQMRSLGLKKLPAWSFIESHGRITTFFKDQSSHPQYDEIVLVLKSLSKEIRSLGMHLKPELLITDSEECEVDSLLLQGV